MHQIHEIIPSAVPAMRTINMVRMGVYSAPAWNKFEFFRSFPVNAALILRK